MGVQIEDGTGGGNSLQVDDENRLHAQAVVQSELEHVSLDKGDAYSWSNVTYDMTAADTILLVKNTSNNVLHIDQIITGADVATEVQIHIPATVATPAGTAVTGVNLNKASSNVAEAVAKGDETANTIGDIVAHMFIAAGTMNVIRFEGALILPKNESVGVDFVANAATCYVTIIGHFGD